MFEAKRWGQIAALRYGKALTDYRAEPEGAIPVFGTNGPIGFTRSALSDGPGVVVGRKGAYRGVHYSKHPFWVIDTAFYLDPIVPMDLRWAYYALLLADINGLDSGSAIPSTTREAFYSLRTNVPSIGEQRAIAEVLGALDDKIAANTKLAAALALLASAEYEQARQGAENIVLLSDLVSTQYGLTTSANDHPGAKLLRVTDINKKPWIEWDKTPNCIVSHIDLQKYRVVRGDILVARMADPGKAAFVDDDDHEAVFASYLVRLKTHDPSNALYIYHFLRSQEYLSYADGAMQGSVQKNMNAKVIVATEIALPRAELIVKFDAAVTPLRASICAALRENECLSAARDVLLPQLMSGKLRVKDAEKEIEGVL